MTSTTCRHWLVPGPTLARLLLALVLAMPILVNLGGNAFAQTSTSQTTAPKSFLPPPKAAEPPSGILAWIMAQQAEVNRRLAAAVREIKTGDPLMATLLLAGLSFAYGVLHAAGPGHGKAVIASYVLANEQTVRRGIALSFLAALFQGLSALVIVAILVLTLRATSLTMKTAEGWLETISWGLVAAIGAWLLYTQLRDLRAQRAAEPAGGHTHHHDHGHHGHAHHDHAHDHAPHRELALATHGHAHQHGGHGHHDHHHHGHSHDAHHGHHHHAHHDHVHLADGSCCDHAHIPDPSQLQGPWSWRQAFAIAFAVGIRPCTGAILVLVFAISQGLMWAGVFATFAMALGTAITVSVLAALAVGSRELAMRIGGGGTSVWGARIRAAAGLGGAALILVLGLVLMVASFNTTTVF